jgi:hypothetical protein
VNLRKVGVDRCLCSEGERGVGPSIGEKGGINAMSHAPRL